MVKIGTAFQLAGTGNHLRVISEPNEKGEVVCVSITDSSHYPDSTCHLEPGDHEFITKRSAVLYKSMGMHLWPAAVIERHLQSQLPRRRFVSGSAAAIEGILQGTLRQYEDFSPEILKRIIDGALLSDDIPEFYRALIKPLR
jgi:hypothetical protein